MAHCPHCDQPFKYKQLIPLSWRSRIGVTCQHCNETSYHSAKSKKRLTFSVLIFPIGLAMFQLIGTPLEISVFICLMLLAGFSLFIPYLVKLSPKEEPLW